MLAVVLAHATDRLIPGVGSHPFDGIVRSIWYDAEEGLQITVPDNCLCQYQTRENVVIGRAEERILPDSIKVMAFIRRREDFSVEAFQTYWATTHADLVRLLPGVSRYVQTHLHANAYASGEPLFDGIAELWWPDVASFEAAWVSPEMAADAEDTAKFAVNGAYIFVAQDQQLV